MRLAIIIIMVSSCGINTNNKKITLECDSISNERLNLSFQKIQIFKLQNDFLHELNDELYDILSEKEPSIIDRKVKFDSTILELKTLRSELIATSGGQTKNGNLINPNGIKYVNEFFYGETAYGNNSHKRFFQIIENFSNEIKTINGTSFFKKLFNERIDFLIKFSNLKTQSDLFRDLTVVEAITIIDRVITEIRIEEYRYLLQVFKENQS
jgi:hypothetical protein